MYAQQPPPRVSSSELRPGRFGYWAGGAVIVVAGIAGVAVFLFFVLRAVALPPFAAEVPNGGQGTFTHVLDADTAFIALYSDSPMGTEGDCELVTPGGEPFWFAGSDFTHETPEWTLVGTAHPAESGEYTMTCDGVPGATYAAASVPADFGLAGNVAGALASFFLIPLAGLVVGLVLIVSTAVRRNNHKRRLLAERAGHPYRG